MITNTTKGLIKSPNFESDINSDAMINAHRVCKWQIVARLWWFIHHIAQRFFFTHTHTHSSTFLLYSYTLVESHFSLPTHTSRRIEPTFKKVNLKSDPANHSACIDDLVFYSKPVRLYSKYIKEMNSDGHCNFRVGQKITPS